MVELLLAVARMYVCFSDVMLWIACLSGAQTMPRTASRNMGASSPKPHAAGQGGKSRAPFKTKMCSYVVNNLPCPMGAKCSFAHSEAEMRPYLPFLHHKGKGKKLCANFAKNGYCLYGNNCLFRHDFDGADVPGAGAASAGPSDAEFSADTGAVLTTTTAAAGVAAAAAGVAATAAAVGVSAAATLTAAAAGNLRAPESINDTDSQSSEPGGEHQDSVSQPNEPLDGESTADSRSRSRSQSAAAGVLAGAASAAAPEAVPVVAPVVLRVSDSAADAVACASDLSVDVGSLLYGCHGVSKRLGIFATLVSAPAPAGGVLAPVASAPAAL